MNFLLQKFGKRTVIIYGVVVLILSSLALFSFFQADETLDEEPRFPAVSVRNVGGLSGDGSLALIGNVASVSEVKLESEASGRITNVRVQLGQDLKAGTTIATLANADQYASLLQAQGSYEAALAAAEISDVAADDANTALTAAKQAAINTNRSALSSWNSLLYNTVDELFSSPRLTTPGVRLSSAYQVSYLNDERVAMRDMLDEWKKEVEALNTEQTTADIQGSLLVAVERVDRLREMVRVFSEGLARQDADQVFTASDIIRLQGEFATAESTLNSTRASLQSANTTLARAEETLTTAELGGTSGEISSANASIKQALGALRAAEANYNKTIIRSPISGTVNSLTVKAGDYISPGTFVANVANNNASIITTFVSAADKERLSVGQEVVIDENKNGIITAIAAGLDPVTKKVRVEIQSDDESLINGDTVRLEIVGAKSTDKVESDSPIIVPVSALKVETDRIVIFTVEDGILVANEVIEGPLQGTDIVIESGLSNDMEIVIDARGLNEGDEVIILE